MIPISSPYIGKEERENLLEAFDSSWISSIGSFINLFEEGFSDYCGVNYGVLTGNGTMALHLALKALDIGEGDEVIVPTLTFIATANAVKYCNAIPIFVDSDEDTWCIDTDKIRRAITPRTKAIIPVHLYGHPCDMDKIKKIAEEFKLKIVEDAAQAHGAEYKNKKVGAFSDISCFSFFGNKIITTGEGGICLTDDQKLYNKMKILRDHGMDPSKKYWYNLIGFNYRMTNLQAAIGVAQLKKIDNFLERRKLIEERYNKNLADFFDKGILKTQKTKPWAKKVNWLYSIILGDSVPFSREEIMTKLKEKLIEVRPILNPIHLMPPYFGDRKYPIAERISSRGISLPSGTGLKDEEIDFVCEALKEILIGTTK